MAETPKRTKRPFYHPLEILKRLVIYPVVIYLVLCGYLWFQQNGITYPRAESGAVLPTAEAIKIATRFHLVPWDHPTPGAESPQGYVPLDFANPAPRGTIVLFHGNGGWVPDRTFFVDAFRARGFRTFLYEYPGYGGRPGRPSEAVIVPDAQALIRLLEKAGYGPIYVWGESLGSGVAAAVCADPTLPVHGLVLVTPWDTIANVGLSIYPYIPVRQLMVDKYDSTGNLAHFGHPICVIRGTTDPVIPPALTLNLYAHLPEPKKLIVQEGWGHGDWPNGPKLPWWDEALDFMTGK